MILLSILGVIAGLLLCSGLVAVGMCNFINGFDNATFKFTKLINEFNEDAVNLWKLTDILTSVNDASKDGGANMPLTLLPLISKHRHKLRKTLGKLRYFRKFYGIVLEQHPFVFDILVYEEVAKNTISKSNDALKLLSDRITPIETGKLKRNERLEVQAS